MSKIRYCSSEEAVCGSMVDGSERISSRNTWPAVLSEQPPKRDASSKSTANRRQKRFVIPASSFPVSILLR